MTDFLPSYYGPAHHAQRRNPNTDLGIVTRRRIMDALRDHSSLSVAELSEKLGDRVPRSLLPHLSRLESTGYIASGWSLAPKEAPTKRLSHSTTLWAMPTKRWSLTGKAFTS